MTAQQALREALRDRLAPAARAHGYKGSPPTWRKTSETGDWAVINVQSSSGSTADHLRCIVNLAVVPEPWLRWQHEFGSTRPKVVNEAQGLYRDRLHPHGTAAGTEGWWDVVDDHSARRAVDDMVRQLDEAGWPVLEQMLSRDGLLARVRAGDLGMFKRSRRDVHFLRAEALLLMDEGPTVALESLLDRLLNESRPTARDHTMEFATWVRGQAARV